ncbi:MAG: hypothetical protein HQL95_11180 [Magnetococcales bacterium]|nr:hypothetical protein [Magnetococcales bacterium]
MIYIEDDVNIKMVAMEENPLPLFVRLTGRACLLVGGGGEGGRKAAALLEAGARLTIVAESLEEELAALVTGGKATWLRESFSEHHLQGVWLVVSVAVDEELNARLHAATLERGLWLNVVDQPRFCTVIWPAVIRRPPVTVAIGTGGAAPALAGYLRRRLDAWLPEGVGELAVWFASWRSVAVGALATRGRFWRTLFDQGVAERFLEGDREGADAMVRQALAEFEGVGAGDSGNRRRRR